MLQSIGIELLHFSARLAIFWLPLLVIIAGHLVEPIVLRCLGVSEARQRRLAGVVPAMFLAILGATDQKVLAEIGEVVLGKAQLADQSAGSTIGLMQQGL